MNILWCQRESLHRLLYWIGHGVSLFVLKNHFNSNKIIITDTHTMHSKSEKLSKPKLILISFQKELIPMHSSKSKLTSTRTNSMIPCINPYIIK